MYRLLILCIVSIAAFTGQAQPLELDIHKNKLPDFIRIEQAYGSVPVEREETYLERKGVAQPLLFRRKEWVVPDLVSYYFFYEQDSSIHYVLYEWDDTNFKERSELEVKSDTEIEAFVEKYKEICAQLTQVYGESKSEGSLADLSKVKNGGLTKKDYWYPDERTEIELYTTLSSRYEKRGFITIMPTYRIRLYIRKTEPKKMLASNR